MDAIRQFASGMSSSLIEVPGHSISEESIDRLFAALREAYGIDFSYYKPNTVARRVERRLQLYGCVDLNDYVCQALADTEELNALYRDLLIGVTEFFRDGEAFDQLRDTILPQLLDREAETEELRIWVAGCATGEEAYSVAILVHEAFMERSRPLNVKIFATDVHRSSLEHASIGVYSLESLARVSSERLQRYFVRHGTGYQVTKELRQFVVFAPHNVVKDAPFTKLHLISCRNLLIYLQPEAQQRAISLFHFALRTGGYLFLGPSESPGQLSDEFESINRHWKFYRKRRDIRLPSTLRPPLSAGLDRLRSVSSLPNPGSRGIPEIHLLRAYDALLEQYVPPSLLVDEQRRLVHTFAGAGHLLKTPDGRPSEDILDYVDRDLKLALAGALQRAANERKTVVYGNVQSCAFSDTQRGRLSVRPIQVQNTGEVYFLVSIEPEQTFVRAPATISEVDYDAASQDRLHDVEEELRYTKENLQATIEEMETTNEELQATNEELVASNEELQSTNEELHSVNEELYTVNAEHQRKITELTELTDDMDNLLRATDIGTVFLDRNLNIRKFTPSISRAFRIMDQDVGRPLDTFSHNIQLDSLLDDVKRVLQTAEPFEQQVQDRQGHWFLLRVLPYHARDGVGGAVLTLIDINQLKKSEEQLRRMSKVFRDGADPIIIEDLQGSIVDCNPEAVYSYGWNREELLGKNISILVPESEVENSTSRRQSLLRGHTSLRNVETVRKTRSGATHPVILTLSLLTDECGKPSGIATIAKDITRRKAAEEKARLAVRRRDEFLAMLSHELRNPLGAVSHAARILTHQDNSAGSIKEAADVILRQSQQMARLLDDLLDVCVVRGKIAIHRQVLDLTQLAPNVVEGVESDLRHRGHELELDISPTPVCVEGDLTRLLQVQQNLLTNAARYTPPGGHIRLSIHAEREMAVIRVEDDGQGIPPELLDSVFELFVQGDKPLDRTDGGMGVGLSLVRTLVELHGGEVTVEIAGQDLGSLFTVRLPLSDQTPTGSAEPADEPSPATTDAGNTTTRVLIVEDNEDSRRMLEELLRLDGYDVAVAADGQAGFDKLAAGGIDVALIDIGLPLLDGFELARKVRSELPEFSTKLVALTGYGREADHREVLAAGFDEHLVKPVAPATLARSLQLPRQ